MKSEGHVCSECGTQFKKSTHLIDHLRIHTGLKPFQCQICSRSFSQHSSLRRHTNNVHTLSASKTVKNISAEETKISSDQLIDHCSEEINAANIYYDVTGGDSGNDYPESNNESASSFSCEICGLEFKRLQNLKYHKESIHINKSILRSPKKSCAICEICFTDVPHGKLKQHKASHRIVPPECNICRKTFASKNNLAVHLMTHSGSKPFRCSCGTAFSQKSSLRRHQYHIHAKTRAKDTENTIPETLNKVGCQEVTSSASEGDSFLSPEVKVLSCLYCQKVFSSSDEYDVHIAKHLKLRPFRCSHCSKAFKTAMVLKKHMTTHVKSHLSCSFCSAVFTNKHSLKSHSREHLGPVKFQCCICSAVFSYKFCLRVHMMKHTGVKPFKCTLCESKFSTKNRLQVHTLRHTGDKPFSCDICKRKFREKITLKRHMHTHNEMKFPCLSCNLTFKKFGHLKLHNRLHERKRKEISGDKGKISKELKPIEVEKGSSEENSAELSSKLIEVEIPPPPPPVSEDDIINKLLNEAFSDSNVGLNKLTSPFDLSKDDDSLCYKKSSFNNFTSDVSHFSINSEGNLPLEKYILHKPQENDCSDVVDDLKKNDQVHVSNRGSATEFSSVKTNNAISASAASQEAIKFESLTSCDSSICLIMQDDLQVDDGSYAFLDAQSQTEKHSELPSLDYEYFPSDAVPGNADWSMMIPSLDKDDSVDMSYFEAVDGGLMATNQAEQAQADLLSKDAEPAQSSKKKKVKGHMSYICEVCGKDCKKSSNYNMHIKVHTGERPYFCSLCGASFRQLPHLKDHILMHNNIKNYACEYCGRKFVQKSSLTRHIKGIHPGGRVKEVKKETYKCSNFYCKICKKSFVGEYKKLHSKKHKPEIKHQCELCGKFLCSKVSLKNHLKMHMVSRSSFPIGFAPEKAHARDAVSTCVNSDEKSLDLNKAEDYVKKSTETLTSTASGTDKSGDSSVKKKRIYKCEFCHKTFRQKSNYITHRRIHTKEEPYKCDICDKSFRVSTRLMYHMSSHTATNLFSCSLCGKDFPTYNMTHSHKQKVHMGKGKVYKIPFVPKEEWQVVCSLQRSMTPSDSLYEVEKNVIDSSPPPDPLCISVDSVDDGQQQQQQQQRV